MTSARSSVVQGYHPSVSTISVIPATLLLGEGVHPKIVSEVLGHSQVSITLDLYSHVTPSMHQEAADVLDRVLAGA